MYPFNFKSKSGFIDFRKIFVVMPFSDEYKYVYTELIIPSVQKVNEKRSDVEKLFCLRADAPKYLRAGWIDILENIFTARIIIGVLSGDNANVFYELGIAHATQQIERQLLLAKKGYKPKFDLKDLIHIHYDPNNLGESISDLSDAICDTLKIYDISHDRQVSLALSKVGVYEFDVVKNYGHVSHFHLRNTVEPRFYDGLSYLCHSGLLRLSTKPSLQNGKLQVEYSYYWTNLGNAVLNRLKIINVEEMQKRILDYYKFFDV